MILISLPPQNIALDLFNPITIEQTISVSCNANERLHNGEDTFWVLANNAITSQKVGLKNRISEIAILKDNWDGYGALALSEDVVNNTFKFIDAIWDEGFCKIKKDDVTPTPYGSVVLDFNSDRGIVSVEIGLTQIGFFTEFVNQEDFASEGIDTDFRSIPENLRKALDALYEE